MKVRYKTQIENEGWNIAVEDGRTSGTVGKGLRLEALIIELLEKAGLDIRIEAQAHVQNMGWLPLKTDGEIIGTVGEGLRLEAVRIRLVGLDAKRYKIKYRTHIENIGWQNWYKDGETAGTIGVALRAEAIEISLELVKEDVVVVVPNKPTDDPTQIIVPITNPNAAIPPEKILCASYTTHVENYGWGPDVTDGRLSGRVGQGLRIEAIRIALINFGTQNLGVAYSSHVENLGWLPEVTNGQTSGTTDQGKRLEAYKIRLTGTDAYKYSIWYRTHVQNEGFQEWCRDGDVSGTVGQALRAEAIEIIITLKSENLLRTPGEAPLIAIGYRSHIQNLDWQQWVKNGTKSGTTGLGLRMEALEVKLSSLDGLDIGVTYRTHVENIGWQPWFKDGETAGTVGQGLRIEAVEIILTGTDADKYTVQYRGHLENSGWTQWKKDGATLGTVGEAIRLEAVSIVLIKNADLNAVITNEVKNKAPYIQIWASDFPRADVLLHDIRTDARLISAKMTEGINKSSGLVFTIDPTHVHYNKLRKMYTTILIYEIYSNTRKELIFEGRILSDDEGFNKTREVTCEGELGYLLDSTQRPAEYINVTPEQWMTMVLDNHNMQVTSDKRIHMGICTVLGDGTGVNISTSYRTHIENYDWLTWIRNGEVSGKTGLGLRMEAIELKLENIGKLNIGITYRAQVQDIGWQEWVSDGATAGTVGQGKRLEAIEIKLTGADAGLFSVEYRAHVEDEGWQDWKKDGETAGTVSNEKRAEAISIIIVSRVDGTNGKLKDGLFRENEYVNTLECIKTTLIDTLGGVLVIERLGGIKFLNYLENYGTVNSQPIKFGVNMLDYSKITDASGIVTVIVPYGKEIDGKKLTIASVNNNSDYIYDEVMVAEYGWITEAHEWPDIDTPSALLHAAKLRLAGKVKQGISFEISAVDLSMVNLDIQKMQVGDMVRCVSKPHEVDTFLSVSKKERDLFTHGNDTMVLGGVTQSLTDRISGPLGGGIMGFALTTANSVKNMEYVANELSFMIRITNETVEEAETRINQTEFRMDAFEISLSAKELQITSLFEGIGDLDTAVTQLNTDAANLRTEVNGLIGSLDGLEEDLGSLVSRVSTAELKITPTAITATVLQSTTYLNDIGGINTRLNAAELKTTPTAITATVMASTTYTNAMAGKANTSDLGNLTSRVDAAELKITPTSIVSTVTSSYTYTNALTGKANKATIISEINQSAEGIKISANKITISGFVTFTEAQTLANTAQTNATSAASTYAANARTNAVSDVSTKLSTAGQTTINGANITTGTITCDRISGGNLNFANITATNQLRISTGSYTAGIALYAGAGTTGKVGSIYSNTTRGLNLESSGGGVLINGNGSVTQIMGGLSVTSGNLTVTNNLAANNIPNTSTAAANKVREINWKSTYVEVSTANGAKGITVWESDRRLKTNIKSSNINALTLLSTTQLRSFNWLSDNRFERCGFVAQEIEAILGEEFVLKVRQEDGSVNYQIKEYPFIPLLVKAVQELNETKIQQSHDIAILKAQIKELKGETIC